MVNQGKGSKLKEYYKTIPATSAIYRGILTLGILRPKLLYDIDFWAQGHKTFFVRKLRIFVITRVFVIGKLFRSSLINTLTLYENM